MPDYPIDLFGHTVHSTDRRCTSCKITKPIERFRVGMSGRTKKTPRRWNECRECIAKRCRKYHKANADSILNHVLLTKYGISLSDYKAILDSQNGVCAICLRPERTIDPRTKTTRRLSVDHNHKTGKVRGLLCIPCNRAIGNLQDDPVVLHSAIEYLKKSEESSGH